MACCYCPIFWTASESSTLDEIGKVLSTLKRPVDSLKSEMTDYQFKNLVPPINKLLENRLFNPQVQIRD
jgi:hypothetical protein